MDRALAEYANGTATLTINTPRVLKSSARPAARRDPGGR
jgi:hypothetical protein